MCNSHGIVFDTQTSETVCSSCGIVLHSSKESFDPGWRKYAEDAQALVEDPWAKADELASSIGLGSKTHFFSTIIFGISSFST
jgi:transcription initiation factor TFIIIB Brf1 subunit/transcription initiation factor TFIIB